MTGFVREKITSQAICKTPGSSILIIDGFRKQDADVKRTSDGVYLREIFLTTLSFELSARELQDFTSCPGHRLYCLFSFIIRLVNLR